jgi:hypothetical protein
MKQKEFITGDLYLAAAIKLLTNVEPAFKLEGKYAQFIFPASEDIYKAIAAYNSGISTNIFDYAHMLKRIKGEVFLRRSLSEPREGGKRHEQ